MKMSDFRSNLTKNQFVNEENGSEDLEREN